MCLLGAILLFFFFSSRRRHTRCALVTGVQTCALPICFALADPIAPFVVINDRDAKTAWSFTLLHEVAHLWIGATGVSGGHFEGSTEQFCNDVASSFLLPPRELAQLAVTRSTSQGDANQLITAFATERLISRSLVAYRRSEERRVGKER